MDYIQKTSFASKHGHSLGLVPGKSRCLVYADFLLSHCSVGMRNVMRGSVLGERNDVNKQRKNPNP